MTSPRSRASEGGGPAAGSRRPGVGSRQAFRFDRPAAGQKAPLERVEGGGSGANAVQLEVDLGQGVVDRARPFDDGLVVAPGTMWHEPRPSGGHELVELVEREAEEVAKERDQTERSMSSAS